MCYFECLLIKGSEYGRLSFVVKWLVVESLWMVNAVQKGREERSFSGRLLYYTLMSCMPAIRDMLRSLR